MVGVRSIRASTVRSITIVGSIDRSRILGGVEAELSVHGALNAFGVVCSYSAGLLGLPAGFAGVAGVVAVAFCEVWVCDAANIGDVAVEDGAFDWSGDGGCGHGQGNDGAV
jgi:hypothetical protein